jgi:hypothetical protein
MLTPPSDATAAADRPGKGRHSPVPFRLNSLAAADGDAGVQQDQHGAAAAQQAPGRQKLPKCLQRRIQPQQVDQQPQQQQPQQQAAAAKPGANSSGGLLGGSAASLAAPPAATAVLLPELPADGSPPSPAFWKQLVRALFGISNMHARYLWPAPCPLLPADARVTQRCMLCACAPPQVQWIATAKQPSQADIEAALRVFDEQELGAAIHAMPQVRRGSGPARSVCWGTTQCKRGT